MHGGRRLKFRREAEAPTMKLRIKNYKPTAGAPFPEDRLWQITGPTFCAGLTEYQGEISGYAPYLKKLFSPYVYYGGNAEFVLSKARHQGYAVTSVPVLQQRDRHRDQGSQQPRLRLRPRRKRARLTQAMH